MGKTTGSYGTWRLAEAADFVPDEAFVQRLWFEGLFKNPLVTTDHVKLALVQPGFWNRGPGPDFGGAVIQFPDSGKQQGPVEIHLTPQAFKSHGHDRDPAYRNLLLHAVWTLGLSPETLVRSDGTAVPCVELSSQLRVPLHEAKQCFSAAPSELKVGARIGRCQNTMANLKPEECTRLVMEAGWFRFHQRVARWRLRSRVQELPTLIWEGLAEVAGYTQNREAMVHLAQHCPIQELREHGELEREALLLGRGGWLEGPVPKGMDGTWRSLWDFWWKVRDDSAPNSPIPWETKSIRPLNRPERRIAALAWISDPHRFDRLVEAVESADTDQVRILFEACSHPEWDFRTSLKGKRQDKAQRLLGRQRFDSFCFNVFWPLAYRHHPQKIEETLRGASTQADSLAARRTRVRLLEGLPAPATSNRLLFTEGCLQIYRDFCLTDRSACAQCEFPEWVSLWKNT